MKFVCQDGFAFNIPCTVSDVNAAFYIYPDLDDTLALPGNHGTVALVDVILSAAGTDTTTGSIFINQRATPEKIMNSANLGTNVSRQYMGCPIFFQPAATLRITQNT